MAVALADPVADMVDLVVDTAVALADPVVGMVADMVDLVVDTAVALADPVVGMADMAAALADKNFNQPVVK